MKTNDTPIVIGGAILAIALAFLCFGCGKKNGATPASTAATHAVSPAPSGAIDYSRPGRQLGAFTMFIVDSYNAFEETKNHAGDMGVLALMGDCSTVAQYDRLDRNSTGQDNQKGMHRQNGWQNSTRTRSGDEIRCATDHTYDPNTRGGLERPGDRAVHTAVLNMKNNTLVSETKKIRGGVIYDRDIYEAIITPDKTLYVQSFTVNTDPMYMRGGKPRATASFFRINAARKEYACIQGDMKNPSIDFACESFSGKAAADIEALAAAHIATPKRTTLKDGKIETTQ